MTRAHRRIHRLIWPVVAILMVFGLAMALKLRPSPDAPAAPSATDTTS